MNSWTRTKNLIDPDRRSTRRAVLFLKQKTARKDRRAARQILNSKGEDPILPVKTTAAWDLA